jgi:hypothetical protein
MRRLICSASFAALFAAAALAQTPAQEQQPPPAKPNVLTVTGCLRAGAEPGTYVLSNLEWRDVSANPTGTAGTGTRPTTPPATPPPAAVSAATLKLVGTGTGTKLSEHVGHKVEVTGTLVDEHEPNPALADGPKPSDARTGSAGDQTQREREAKPQTRAEHALNVRTVKMVAEKCEP